MIHRWSEGAADQNMPESILVELGAAVRAHPWWRARAEFTLALMETMALPEAPRVLDVGCGWGVTLEALERRGHRVEGLDISRRALDQLDRPDRTLIEADLARPVPDGAARYDAVLALDVIEHIDDDRDAVQKLACLTKPGGAVIVSVPALPDLYSEFDEVQGHRRRYMPDTLRAVFAGSGLVVERDLWWGAWMVPVVRHQRRRPSRRDPEVSADAAYLSYLRLPPWPFPSLMMAAYRLERRKALRGRLRTGTSLFAIARRTVPSSGSAPA